ncbi:MAG: hypothetical protein WCZ72_01085 [Gemmobacter sp.]
MRILYTSIIIMSGAALIVNAFPSKQIDSIPIICPADIYSSEYERYLEQSQKWLNFTLEPQIFGTEEDIERLIKEYYNLPRPEEGVSFIMTNNSLERLHVHACTNCDQEEYQRALKNCQMALGSQCRDFAIIVDGQAQCLVTPRSEF